MKKPSSEHDALIPTDLDSLHVSEWSSFGDGTWRVAKPPAGQSSRYGAINWRHPLPDGSHLTNTNWEPLLREFKVLVWTLLFDPREGAPLSFGTMRSVQLAIGTTARWMVDEGLTSLAEIDNISSWSLIQYFLDHHEIVDEDPPRKGGRAVTWASASNHLRLPLYIYRQRRALGDLGVLTSDEAPYDGRAIDDVVKTDLDLQRGGKLEPIPDEVVVPVLSSAHRLIGAPADDVIALQEICLKAFETGGRNHLEKYRASMKALKAFQFTTLDGEATPWQTSDIYRRALRDGREGTIFGRQHLRRLIITIQSACIVTLQACSGIRAQELCGLEDTLEGGDWPSCLEVRTSADGMFELFYCKGAELKSSKGRVEWVIGARSVGSDFVPPPVRAMKVLHRLYLRWRRLGRSSRLLVTFSSAKGLPREASSVGTMTATASTLLQKDFLHERCDLSTVSTESRERFLSGDGMRGHLWRTTFAIFLFRINPGLIEAISRHFRHMSIAMTERHYVGNDVALLETMDSVRVTESAKFFLEAVQGKDTVVGSLAKLVAEHQSDLVDPTALPTLEIMRHAVIENDLRLISYEHGVCGIRISPSRSLCNTKGGTSHWANTAPNHAFKSISTCLGCSCFSASRANLPFWQRRLASIESDYGAEPGSGEHRILKLRRNQAEAIVRALMKKVKGEASD